MRLVLGLALSLAGLCLASEKHVRDGVVMEFSADPSELVEGEVAQLRFRLTDQASGQPLRNAAPGAWLDMAHVIQPQEGGTNRSCREKVSLYLRGIVGIRPMLDLNSYDVILMNRDASISVLDPLVSMGGTTSTRARVNLAKPAADWARSADGKRLYISMPQAGQVAVVEGDSFRIAANVDAGRSPTRVALQPDGRYLWAGNNARRPGQSGVTVIDTQTLTAVKSIATGMGHHEIAFSEDSRHALVTNRDAGTLTVIDVRTLQVLREHRVGEVPISVAYSPLSKAAYVADAKEGVVTVLAGAGFEPTARIQLKRGLGPIRFTPDGRYGLAVNPHEDLVHVIDVSSTEHIHDIAVAGQPYQLAFTRAFAYVRALASERVTMINLSALAPGVKPIVQSFAAGGAPPKAAGDLPLADSIVPAIGDAAVLVINPADNTTYFYMEGMNAPTSSYQSRGAAARAVTLIDRSLKEIEPGIYASTVRIPAAGRYDIAMMLNSPRLVQCFSAEAKANPARAQAHGRLEVEFLLDKREVAVGQTVPVRFRIKDAGSGAAKAGLKDVQVLSFMVPGQRRSEVPAKEVEPGIYEAGVAIPEHGAYSVHVGSKTLKKGYRGFSSTTLYTPRPDLEAEMKRR
jgi:YVTN family beta-propeller protein